MEFGWSVNTEMNGMPASNAWSMTGLSESTLTAATAIPSTFFSAIRVWINATWSSAAPVGGPDNSASTPSSAMAFSTPAACDAVYELDTSLVR